MSPKLEAVTKLVVGRFEPGLCGCGCNQATRMATTRDARFYGVNIGTPLAFAPHHGKRMVGRASRRRRCRAHRLALLALDRVHVGRRDPAAGKRSARRHQPAPPCLRALRGTDCRALARKD